MGLYQLKSEKKKKREKNQFNNINHTYFNSFKTHLMSSGMVSHRDGNGAGWGRIGLFSSRPRAFVPCPVPFAGQSRTPSPKFMGHRRRI